jgi:glycosyltransferase involved in cell wall biosynthesis
MNSLSVVFPNYNHAKYLAIQLESIISQSLKPLEIIIIDDASTDDSVKIIERYMTVEPRIRLIKNQINLGVEANINRLINLATGDYIYLSAADDVTMPGLFEKSMKLLSEHPSAGLCSGLGRMIGEFGEDRGLRVLPIPSRIPCYMSPEQVQEKLIKYGRWFAISSMILRKDAIIAEGGQNIEFGSFADNFLALVVALKHGACFIPEPFSCWRQMRSGHGTSSVADWNKLNDQRKVVCGAMRSKYKELFPSCYVNAVEKHWIYMITRTAGNSILVNSKKKLTYIITIFMEKSGIFSLLYLRILNIFFILFSVSWAVHCMIRYAPWGWWLMGRLSILLNYGKIKIIEKQDV